jgi:hypothetical protein
MRVITTEETQAFRAQFHSLLDEMLDKLFFVGEQETPPIADTFFDEINEPVSIVADEPEQEPQLADLTDIEVRQQAVSNPFGSPIVEHLKEKFELEEETPENFIQRDTKEFLALIEFSMLKNWQKSHVDNFLLQKGLALSAKNEDVLNELRKFGAMVKAGDMDVPTLLDQTILSDAERAMLTEKYIF